MTNSSANHRNSALSDLPRLPVGSQSFNKIRRTGAVYVDKTQYLVQLPQMGEVVFCARPRRFGKSLTVSTLEAMFTGQKELFAGLAAEKHLSDPAFTPRPVIKLDLSEVTDFSTKENFEKDFLFSLQCIAETYGLTLRALNPARSFNFLVRDIAQKTGLKPVILIDEYDSPVLGAISNLPLLPDIRNLMSGFYNQIKATDEYTHFTFITGISKFTKMGVFSSLNNIIDISLDPRFSALMGYTHEEFEKHFQPYLSNVSEKSGIPAGDLPKLIEEYYNGFSFDGETRVYNPFSTLCLMQRGEFDNYWMESGSMSFIQKFLKDQKLTLDQFRNMAVSRQFITSPGEIESTSAHGFLYQAGYLTLRKKGADYFLDFPNTEVLSSFSRFLLQDIISNEDKTQNSLKKITACLEREDIPALVREVNLMYASVPYPDYQNAEKRELGEGYYRSLLYLFLNCAGARTEAEACNNLGRSDIVAHYRDWTYIIELKVAEDAARAETKAVAGMEQIHSHRYGNRWENPILVSIAIDEERRQIGSYRCDKPLIPILSRELSNSGEIT
ncbi:MAG: ATP-binding protein [Candidatus Adiutrix sp.]|jgi:hypothetical protein|nr:ATP-binding protein [Candidatus Adiutrix sp.]